LPTLNIQRLALVGAGLCSAVAVSISRFRPIVKGGAIGAIALATVFVWESPT
jgi:hypothetical protein